MEEKMDSFEALLQQEEEKKLTKLTPGQQIKAEIVGISGESVFLDVGGKSEGILNSSEVTDQEGEISVKIGDSIEVYYIQTRGAGLMFTTKVGSGSSPDHLEEAWRSQIPVEGLVKAEIKGGFEITLGGKIRAFCPYSQMGLRRVENAGEEYLEKTMTFLISKFEENGRNIVVSARAILEIENEKRKEELKKTLQEGQTVEGEITSIRDFGAFMDIGGVEGLIPISEIGWSRVEKVEEYLSVGQRVSAVIKSLDWEKDRISFSLKETLENPWEKASETFTPGSTHAGKIVRLAPFGAFVNLAPAIDGLVHISKLGNGRKINHPREVVEVDQEYEVTVESFDVENKKISLAPVDYVSQQSEEMVEKAEYQNYKAKQKKSSGSSMGSLGALLQAKMDEKKKS